MLAVLVHGLLVVSVIPFERRIPLMRHLGYEGPLRMLPEISELREPGPAESELTSFSGRGSQSALRVLDIRIVEESEMGASGVQQETGHREETLGDELLTRLESSLPQPTSRDLVIVRLVKPVYPRASVADGVEGVVTFRVHITSEGTVARVWLLSSQVDRACEEAARRALLQWRFRPFLMEGEPSDVLVDQRIRFSLLDAGYAPGPR